MELTYRMENGYRLPNLDVPEAPKVGKYGMLRRSYLKNHRSAYYTGMLLSGRLNAHLEKIDRGAFRWSYEPFQTAQKYGTFHRLYRCHAGE